MIDLILYLNILFRIFLPVYGIYFLSTIFHEWSHELKARKYGINVLNSRKEVKEANQLNDLAKFSFFILGFEFRFLGANLHVKNGQIEKLAKGAQKEILLGGIKSDLIFMYILVFIGIVTLFIDLYQQYFLIIIFLSLLMILGETKINMTGNKKRKGDFNQLFELIQRQKLN